MLPETPQCRKDQVPINYAYIGVCGRCVVVVSHCGRVVYIDDGRHILLYLCRFISSHLFLFLQFIDQLAHYILLCMGGHCHTVCLNVMPS